MKETAEIERKADQFYDQAIKTSIGLEFALGWVQLASTKDLATEACHLYCQVLSKDPKRKDIAKKIEDMKVILDLDKSCSDYSRRSSKPIDLYKKLILSNL